MKITILGLSITSSWGNGHATNYRGLARELGKRGHEVLFLERDVPWYAANRDLTGPLAARARVYSSLQELRNRFAGDVRDADAVVVGSYVPDGAEVGAWVVEEARGVTAFYDIDTPVTLAKLQRGDHEYLEPRLVPRFDLYLSFAGGRALELLRERYGAPRPRPFYCCVDPEQYWPEEAETRWDLGYLGTYSADRQPALDRLLLGPARAWPGGRFAVFGPQYPDSLEWPPNVERDVHLAPTLHRGFYRAQRFTLNVTRADMVRAGHSPSVRLFEAAGCGTPVISDSWEGLGEFFEPDSEILIAESEGEVLGYLRGVPDEERVRIGERARRRVLAAHTAAHRAAELEAYIREVRGTRGARSGCGGSGAGEPSDRSSGVPRRTIEALGPWFQNLRLPDGTETAPDHPFGDFPRWKWESFAETLPVDLSGWTALDLGCNAGFYAFELAGRGAEVLAVDVSPHYLRQARWAARELGLVGRIEFRQMQLYDLARMEGAFDLVLFMGLFYHLRYPLLALDLVSRKVGRRMVFQSLTMPGESVREDTRIERINEREALAAPGWPAMAFIEEELAGDPTNWWVPNHACVLAVLRSCGMRVVDRPAHEIYLCEPDAAVRRVVPDEAEYEAAIGARGR